MKPVVAIGAGCVPSTSFLSLRMSLNALSGAGCSVLQLHLVACRGFEAEAQGGFKPNARLRGAVERGCVYAVYPPLYLLVYVPITSQVVVTLLRVLQV